RLHLLCGLRGVPLRAVPHLHLEGARAGELPGRGCHDARVDRQLAAAVPHLRGAAAHPMSELSPVRTGEAAAPTRLVPGDAEVRDWIALLKPRVMSLVVFTGLIGLLIAPGHLHPVLGFTAVLCITVAAGACGAINMWYDRDIDAVMHRTQSRPIPAGCIEPGAALGFGVTLAVGSVIV